MANNGLLVGGIIVVIIIVVAAFLLTRGPTTTTTPTNTTTGNTGGTGTTTPGGSNGSTNSTSNSTTSNSTTNSTTPTPPGQGTESLTETEWLFTPSTLSIANNTAVTFTITNNGNYGHNFVIADQNGNVVANTTTIAPGGSDTLTYTFVKKGAYTFFSSAISGKLGDQAHGLSGNMTVT